MTSVGLMNAEDIGKTYRQTKVSKCRHGMLTIGVFVNIVSVIQVLRIKSKVNQSIFTNHIVILQ